MTSLQNQIIKYGKKKHFGSAKDFFFFLCLGRKWTICDSCVCGGTGLCRTAKCKALQFFFQKTPVFREM